MAVKFVREMPKSTVMADALRELGMRPSPPTPPGRVVRHRGVDPVTGKVLFIRERWEELPNVGQGVEVKAC
jgi:hypothetical protein